MALTTDMLKVIQLATPEGAIPEGMKVTSIAGPNTGSPAAKNTALAIGGFTLWPLSYIDNRVSYGMAMYDPQGKLTNQVEKPGARYIYKITIDGPVDTGTVSFWGQADQKVTMQLQELAALLESA